MANDKNSNLLVIKNNLDKSTDKLAMLLDGSGVSVDKFREIAWSTVRKNSFLMTCTPSSIVSSIIEAAQVGLKVDGILGEAYLVPMGKIAQLIPGYRGLRKLALQSNNISKIEAHVVFEGEEFTYLRKDGQTFYTHNPGINPFLIDKSNSNIIGAYAYAYYNNFESDDGARLQIEVLSREQIEFLRNCSKAKNAGAWKNHYDEMARKSVLRRLCKHLPLDEKVLRLVNKDEALDFGIVDSNVSDDEPSADEIIEAQVV